MTIDGENISYKVNDRDLGVCFTDKRFVTSQIFPCVFILEVPDQVYALKGSITQYTVTSAAIAGNEIVKDLQSDIVRKDMEKMQTLGELQNRESQLQTAQMNNEQL